MFHKSHTSKRIVIKDLFGTTVSTRQAVQELAKQIPAKASQVFVDFEEVEFVSRSFAHEFSRFQKTNPTIEVMNLSKNVKKMFDVVRQSTTASYSEEDITDSSINITEISHF